MDIKKIKRIIDVTVKAKDLTTKGVDLISKITVARFVTGAVITLVPGTLVVGGAYLAGRKIIKKYKELQKQEDTQDIEQTQLEIEFEDKPKTEVLKEVALKTASDVGQAVSEQTAKTKRKVVKKVAKLITKDDKWNEVN